jgi:hypothetical protein
MLSHSSLSNHPDVITHWHSQSYNLSETVHLHPQPSSYKVTRHPSWKAATHKSRNISTFNARSKLTRRRQDDPINVQADAEDAIRWTKLPFIKPRATKVYEECCAFFYRTLALYNKDKAVHLLTSLVLTDTHLQARFINSAGKSRPNCNTLHYDIFHNEPHARYRSHSLCFPLNKVLGIQV